MAFVFQTGDAKIVGRGVAVAEIPARNITPKFWSSEVRSWRQLRHCYSEPFWMGWVPQQSKYISEKWHKAKAHAVGKGFLTRKWGSLALHCKMRDSGHWT